MTRIACFAVLLCVACSGTVETANAETPDGGDTCTPFTACGAGQNCGSVSDGCGGSVSCGTCGSGQSCGGGGTANVCGAGSCSPTTCVAQGKNCGTISDGCSSVLQCGTCSGGQSCGGGGTPNVCGGSACTPTTCSAQGKNCGAISDGCGNTLQCGSCSGSDTCGGGGSPNVCGSGSAIDQSILPAAFQTLWDPGIPGGIPADNDPVHPASVWLPSGNPYGGYSVDPTLTGPSKAAQFTSAFQAAINSAGAAATASMRKIVKLKAGTYFVNPQDLPNAGGQVGIYVRVDNVTIRGEGADTTRIVANATIPDYGAVILFGHRSGTGDASFGVQALTADAARGATTIKVGNGAGFAVGDVVTIDMLDGAAVKTGAVYLNGGYLWFYDGQYFKRQPTYGWSGPSTGAPAVNVSDLGSANSAAQNAVPSWRSRMQANEIVAISGNTLTLKDPLNLDFPLSSTPQVWKTIPANTSGSLGNRWSGIENVAVAGGNNQWGFPGGTVVFSYMAYCWAKNVEADGERWTSDPVNHPGKYGYNIGIGRSYRCVVRDSYAHGSADENPGGQAYGIVVGAGSSACLVENNISVENNKPIALNSTGGGNVIAYNYVDQAVLWSSPGWQENAIDDCHANFTHHDLIEGNWSPNLGGDTTHGNSGWHTHFRNYVNGKNSSGSFTANLRAVGMDGWTHDHAYVGNILKGGTVYQTTPSSQNGTPIYQLGNNAQGMGGNWDNGYALAHIFRDGNWDNVNNAVVWANGAKTVPSSFYLTAKPAFFGASAWPWVNPLTGQTSTLPAKVRYDAQTPNVVP
jgi:hypothetical protein